jgi:hypothetical protein
MGDFFSDCIVNDDRTPKLLYPCNKVPIPVVTKKDIPINENNDILMAYSIISPNPDVLNEILSDPDTDLKNVRTVNFTKQVNCSLIADQLSPENGRITKWTIDDASNDFRKVVYPGVGPSYINNNVDLQRQQTLGVEGSIHCWCLNNLYPSGYASSKVGVTMKDYPIFIGKSISGPLNARCDPTCYQLLKDLKFSVNKPGLKVIPQYETVGCSNLQWTSFNKFSDASVMETVEQIINPPIRTSDVPDPCLCNDNFFNSYFNSIENCQQQNCDCDSEETICGYTGFVNDDKASLFFPYLNLVANNYVNLQNIVYVDAFKENHAELINEPVLLKLIFNTQFYYTYDQLPEPIINNDCVNALRWNPSPRVYFPRQADYLLIDEDINKVVVSTI